MSGGRGGFVPVSSSPHASPRNMIDAISEIQQYHIIERTGQDIPSDFLTMRGTLTFFLVGARSGFWEGAFLALLLPLAWGVWEEVIPGFRRGFGSFRKVPGFSFRFRDKSHDDGSFWRDTCEVLRGEPYEKGR